MTPSRLRLLSMLAILVAAGVAALSWSQTWYVLTISGSEYPIPGSVAGGVLLPLVLASLCLLAALALAGPVFRVILSVLQALLGVCVVVVTVYSLSDPFEASRPVVTDATGLTGEELSYGLDVTLWPWIGLAGGILMILVGLALAVTVRAWPVSGRKYSRTRMAPEDGDPIQDWDALSEGDDPTA